MLCQLSYAHQCRRTGSTAQQNARYPTGHRATEKSIAAPGRANERSIFPLASGARLRLAGYFGGCGWLAYFAAISRAFAESGPGCGTNSASR